MKLIIEIPCDNGEQMENRLNKMIKDFGEALKKRGFNEMNLMAAEEVRGEYVPIYQLELK
jgi:hypothetical protein